MDRRESGERPEVGRRVVLSMEVDSYPHALVQAGAAGVITHADDDRIRVRLDDPHPGLDAWDNELVWDREQECEDGRSLSDAFMEQVEYEAASPAP